jgi:hypothetical protein
MFDAERVMSAWGFRFSTVGFTWVKTNPKNSKPFFGIGYHTKSNCEFCLIGIRGKAIKPATHRVSSVIIASRALHSVKPAEARNRLELMYGDKRKIELFARERHPGWEVWGNEVACDHPSNECPTKEHVQNSDGPCIALAQANQRGQEIEQDSVNDWAIRFHGRLNFFDYGFEAGGPRIRPATLDAYVESLEKPRNKT